MPGRLVETMNHEQFVDFINSAYMNSKGITIYNDENPAPNIHTDWQRETIKSSSPVQDYSISLNGTSGDTQYMMSGGVYLQDKYPDKITLVQNSENMGHEAVSFKLLRMSKGDYVFI